jgi:hypothetical protein
MNPEMALELARQIAELLRTSGATQAEQFSVLDIARALVPISGASLTPSALADEAD